MHVRQSQYCLQVVRCTSVECCGTWRSDYLNLLPDRFLPAPVPYVHTRSGISAAEIDDKEGRFGSLYQRMALSRLQPKNDFKSFPFDFYCTSIHDQLNKRTCRTCGLYFPSQVALKNHQSLHSRDSREKEKDVAPRKIALPCKSIPVLDNIFDLMQSPFIDAD